MLHSAAYLPTLTITGAEVVAFIFAIERSLQKRYSCLGQTTNFMNTALCIDDPHGVYKIHLFALFDALVLRVILLLICWQDW